MNHGFGEGSDYLLLCWEEGRKKPTQSLQKKKKKRNEVKFYVGKSAESSLFPSVVCELFSNIAKQSEQTSNFQR